jgi:hypothetical protein
MAHVIERAPSGRSKCRGCGQAIAAGEPRFGERLPNPFAEGEMTHWYHPACGAYKRPEPFLPTLEGHEGPLDDAERLKAAARLGIEHPRVARIDGAARAPSGRAACRSCRAPIEKGAWRIGLVFFESESGRFEAAGFIHPRCAQPYFGTRDVLDRVRHFSRDLGDADTQGLQAELDTQGPPSAAPESDGG